MLRSSDRSVPSNMITKINTRLYIVMRLTSSPKSIVLHFERVPGKMPVSSHLSESYSAVLTSGTVYYGVQDGFNF